MPTLIGPRFLKNFTVFWLQVPGLDVNSLSVFFEGIASSFLAAVELWLAYHDHPSRRAGPTHTSRSLTLTIVRVLTVAGASQAGESPAWRSEAKLPHSEEGPAVSCNIGYDQLWRVAAQEIRSSCRNVETSQMMRFSDMFEQGSMKRDFMQPPFAGLVSVL